MNPDINAINWFEIPVTNIQRAKHFYQVVFSIHMHDMEMPGMHMALFFTSMDSGKIGGALVQSSYHLPGMTGPVIYMNGDPDLSNVLERGTAEGCNILMAKTAIGNDYGYMGFFEDTEGNRIGLHSMQ